MTQIVSATGREEMAAKISELTRRHCRALCYFMPGRRTAADEKPNTSMRISLARRGLLQNRGRGIWTLTPAGLAIAKDWEAQR